jgi:hypothetical protein
MYLSPIFVSLLERIYPPSPSNPPPANYPKMPDSLRKLGEKLDFVRNAMV